MSGYSGYLVTGMEVFLGLIIGLLIYLWMPNESAKSRKKRKQAIVRMNDSMIERVDSSAGLVAENGYPFTSSVSSHEPSRSSHHLLPDDREANPQHSRHTSPPQCRSKIPLLAGRTGPHPVWHHDRMNTFYSLYVAPHRKVLDHAGYLRSINALLDLLDEHGGCPSVVRLNMDREYQETRNVYDLLAKISLLDHSLNVAEQMIANVTKGKAKDPEMLMGKILVTALGHDTGKIPQLIETQEYSKGDHPYISYLVLKRAIFTDSSPQQEEILKAVREHHYQVREGFTCDLRKADQAAREMETEMLSLQGEATSELIHMIQEQKISETQGSHQTRTSSNMGNIPELLDLSWLDLSEFLSAIEPLINLVEDGTHFRAFSMNDGLVYLTLDLVSETVIHLAQKHNHPEVLINADTKEKKRAIEYTVKTSLNEQGYIPSFIGEGYSGARFAVIHKKNRGRTIGIYMPIEVRAFRTSLADLEKRKKNAPLIKKICEVRPLIGKKK
jgi:HD domain